MFSISYTGFLLPTWDELGDIPRIDKDRLNLSFYIGNFVSLYLIITRNLPVSIDLFKSQWTTNPNKSQEIKSSLVFGERGKPEYTGKNHSEESIEPTNPSQLWRRDRNRTQDTLVEGGFSHHFANTAWKGVIVLIFNFQPDFNPFI